MLVLGESLLLGIDKKDLRISKEWLGDQWINVEAKADIMSVISVPLSSSGIKPSMSSSTQEDLSGAEPIAAIQEENQNLNLTTMSPSTSDDPSKAKELVNCEKSPSLRDNNIADNKEAVDADDSSKVDDCHGDRADEDLEGSDDGDGTKLDVVKEIETSELSCKAAETMIDVMA